MQALLHHTADKYLNRLNADDRDRIRAALKNLVTHIEPRGQAYTKQEGE